MDQDSISKPGASVSTPDHDSTHDSTIDQLRFLAVDDLLILLHLATDHMSITAIAEKLSLTQPAITQRIRKMEEAFSRKLIERKGRGIQLTPFGRIQAARATAAIAALQHHSDSIVITSKGETTSQQDR